jgi:hypothetical protein
MGGKLLGLLPALALVLALPAAQPAPAAAVGGLEGVPGFQHVVVLVEENESASATWGAASPATYLNSLRASGVFDPSYYATGHVSLDNYIEMVSGIPDQPLSGSDCEAVNLWTCVQAQVQGGGFNLADQLDNHGVSWKGYMDGMPSRCFHADYSPTALPPDPYQGNGGGTATYRGDYADRHDPFLYFPDIVGNGARCAAHVRPYTELAADIADNRVPAFAFITPDTCHDGHDAPCSGGAPGGLVSLDAWLQQQLPALLSYLNAHDGLLLITFDEGATSDVSGCCTGGPLGLRGFGGQVGLLALGPTLRHGATVGTQYDHASLLRTVEDSFGISTHLNDAATASPMADLLAP